jgi:hypothetical protein
VNVPPQLSSLGRMNTLASRAEQLARALQEPIPCRWAHSQGVAARARGLAPALSADAGLLEATAWLHDIGYARTCPHGPAPTRWRPVPARRPARRRQAVPTGRHHSCAIIEAGDRGLADVLSLEFKPALCALSSVLTFCDMTTSPDGEPVPVEQLLAEIQHRYGPGHLVSRSIQRATPDDPRRGQAGP